jgi:hypothetical protein
MAFALVDRHQRLNKRLVSGLPQRYALKTDEYRNLLDTNQFDIFRFNTVSVFFDGHDICRLYRGHRLNEEFTPEKILQAAIRAGQYLTRNTAPDGKFTYSYRPDTNYVSPSYNILRHAGTIYAMLELFAATGESKLLESSKRALKFLGRSVSTCQQTSGPLPCVVERGHTKLGGNALTALAIAKYIETAKDPQYLPLMIGLGNWIRSVQDETGRFFIHRQSHPEGKISNFVSGYYPGEAILALVRIYALDPDPKWLDSAEAGARYLINVRDAGLKDAELPHDHWLLYGLNELYRHRPAELYTRHALRIAAAIVESQNRKPPFPDWRGGFLEHPGSASAATRLEGLIAAYGLARDSGHPKEAQALLEAMTLSAAFQLQTQFGPESVIYFKNPERALDGFHRSLTEYEIRIDYLQHNISGLLGLHRILEDTPANGAEWVLGCTFLKALWLQQCDATPGGF